MNRYLFLAWKWIRSPIFSVKKAIMDMVFNLLLHYIIFEKITRKREFNILKGIVMIIECYIIIVIITFLSLYYAISPIWLTQEICVQNSYEFNTIVFRMFTFLNMEYNIFRYMRQHFRVPYFIRSILSAFFLPIALICIVLPIFPFSLFVWVFLLIVGIILFVPWSKLRHVIKMRKSIIYLFQNIREKRIIRHKVYDIITHTKSIMRERKEKQRLKKWIKSK